MGAAIVALAFSLAQEPTVALRAGRILPIQGEEIADGVILIRGARIVAIGHEGDFEVPLDAEVIEAPEGVVMPGLIEAHTSRGLDTPNEQVSSVPFVRVLDGLHPLHPYFEDSLRQGITTLHVIPGNQTVIGGRGAVVKPVGITVEEMTVMADVSMKISLAPRWGESRMAHVAELRKELDDIRDYLRKREEEEQPEVPAGAQGTRTRDELEIKREAMGDLFAGRYPGFVYCPGPTDVDRALAFAQEYGFPAKLVLGRDAWRAADALAARNEPVILDPALVYWEWDADTGREVRRVAPSYLHERGVRFALQTDSGGSGTSLLWYQAATCVRYGVPREEALRAITLTPAEILGIADRVGSIEVGKDANLLVLTGDPLDARTWVDQVLIEGRVVYRRSEDAKLRDLIGGED